MRLSRRALLSGVAAAVAAGLMSRGGRAEGGARRLVFVFNPGGWDPTRVLLDGFDHPLVDMEPAAERGRINGLDLVLHPARPSVTRFFDRFGDRAAVLHGLSVPSLFHQACTKLVLTGASTGERPDWPARIAGAAPEGTLPHLVLGGPSFPGPHVDAVARVGEAGELGALAGAELEAWTGAPGPALSDAARAQLHQHLLARGERAIEQADNDGVIEIVEQWTAARRAARALEQTDVPLRPAPSLTDAAVVAAEALNAGLCRCVSLVHGAELRWDSHANNDVLQSPLWEELFAGLEALADALGPGLDETAVVVLSEMGRTPTLNDALGKHHWPYTSALLFGAGVAGGRMFGAMDADFHGQPVDPVDGGVASSGAAPDAVDLGATLLALAGVEPEAGTVIEAMLV